MAWQEKPPILSGNSQQDLKALHDYLFRMAGSLEPVVASAPAASVTYDSRGREQYSPGSSVVTDKTAIEAVRKNAAELQALIIKTADNLGAQIESGDTYVMEYVESTNETFRSDYVAQSEFGAFQESITTEITQTAKDTVESYNYDQAISAVTDSVNAAGANIQLLQSYITDIDGEIRRGIVKDPTDDTYVVGIAISQNLSFSGEVGELDPNNPNDGYTYYYLEPDQTFGLYTSTGWQFWIDGYKRGWFDSQDGMLHVANIYVESTLQIGPDWEFSYSQEQSGPSTLWLNWVGTSTGG